MPRPASPPVALPIAHVVLRILVILNWLMAGAIYFVSTAWTTMTGRERLIAVVGAVELFAWLLLGAARLSAGGEGLHNVRRVLAWVACATTPVAAAAAGELLSVAAWPGAIACVVTWASGVAFVRELSRCAATPGPWSIAIDLVRRCTAALVEL